MADKTIPQVPDDLKEFHKWTENADWSWPMGTVKHMARDLIDRIAKAESERDSLQQEVATARENIGIAVKKWRELEAENATLRAQVEQIDAENDELLTEINQLYMQLERQQRAVTDEEWKVITDTLDSLTKWSAGGFKNEDGWSPMWNPTLRRLRNLVASRASSPEQARATETEEKEPVEQLSAPIVMSEDRMQGGGK